MKVTYYPNLISNQKTILILGSFETIHNGHLKLIEKAKEFNLPIVIMLIENPNELPKANEKLFASLNVRLQQIANFGIQFASIVKFNNEIKWMNGKDFLDKLIKSCNAQYLISGADFRCGNNKALDHKSISNIYQQKYKSINIQKYNNQKISTSLLKNMIIVGDVDSISELSPNSYTIDVIVNNDNEFEIKTLVPHSGIYFCNLVYENMAYPCIVHIDLKQKGILFSPTLTINLSQKRVFIVFIKTIRIIVKSSNDKIYDNDKENLYL